MSRISRHKIDVARAATQLGFTRKNVQTGLDVIADAPTRLSLLAGVALDQALLESVVNPDSDEVVPGLLNLAAEAYVAMFTAARSVGSRFTLSLEPLSPVEVDGFVDESYLDSSMWMQAFFLAAISRRVDLLDDICRTTPDMLRFSSTVGSEYKFLMVDALRGLWLPDAPFGEVVEAAMEATDEQRYELTSVEHTVSFDVPMIQLIYYLGTQDTDFQEVLDEAIENYKQFWSKTLDRRRTADGFLSIPLIGICSLANDWELEYSVDSDYVPEYLVRGLFLDE